MPSRPSSGRDPMWTVGELLAWTQSRFKEAGLDSPRVDAEYLLAHAMGCSRLSLYVRHHEVVGAEIKAEFRAAVKRRLTREPVAYIEGKRGFHGLGLELDVDRRVLIPRPDTEHLVDWLVEELPCAPAPIRLLDVGTGSGAIALALATCRPDAEITACDVSKPALDVAQHNAQRLGLHIDLYCSDLLNGLEVPPQGWTAIAANLPYIPSAEIEGLQPEVVRFEPRSALDGGEDGLSLIRRLIEQVRRRTALIPGGRIYLEVGAGQAKHVASMLGALGFSDVQMRSDYGGIQRVVRALAPVATD